MASISVGGDNNVSNVILNSEGSSISEKAELFDIRTSIINIKILLIIFFFS